MMPPAFQDSHVTVYQGDALEVLRRLPEGSVHCCVTSPPYWGLRDYGVAGQLGLEKTPEEYVARMVAVFREVRRVLREDGVCWLNMGDCYHNGDKGSYAKSRVTAEDSMQRSNLGANFEGAPNPQPHPLLKPKDLVGVPWMVAFALRADGWWLRQDIVWHKRNCMPESVTDRCTRSHEFIFMLTKRERYFYDAEAIKEPAIYDVDGTGTAARKARAHEQCKLFPTDERNGIRPTKPAFEGKNKGMEKQRGHSRRHDGFNERWDQMEKEEQCTGMRNKRSVWTVAPASYPDAHFATYPPALILPCILAGTSEGGCCALCGAPRVRITAEGEPDVEHQRACGGDRNGEYHGTAVKPYAGTKAQNASAVKARILSGLKKRVTTGWRATCACGVEEVRPCVVLDPFAGSGTTGAVAKERGRKAILIELNPDYVPLIEQRHAPMTPGLGI